MCISDVKLFSERLDVRRDLLDSTSGVLGVDDFSGGTTVLREDFRESA